MLAQDKGWRVGEVICGSGPRDRPFEEVHAWTSVAAVVSGVFSYRSYRGRALMVPGSLLLGNAGSCFECGHEHGTGDRCVAFQLAPDLVEETFATLDGPTQGRFTGPSLPPLERLLPLGIKAKALAASPDPLRAESLILEVARTAFALDTGRQLREPSWREEIKAADAVRIVDACYAERLTVAKLAHQVGLGRQRFALAFRRAVGVTPYAHSA
jgi:AraC family transcriptional regulator